MNKYRISESEIMEEWKIFRANYPPFVPFQLDNKRAISILEHYNTLLKTQNGMDFDDYCVIDNNKVERYLKNIQSGAKILLLGTGTGREVRTALEMGLDAYGTTLGNRNIIFSETFVGLEKDRVFECTNDAIPWPDQSFNVIAGFQVFEHVLSPSLFLREQYRLLKPGGLLILEWPPPDNYTMDDNPHHQVCFIPGQASALLKKNGFKNIKLVYDDMQAIPKDKIWDGKHNKMLVVAGNK